MNLLTGELRREIFDYQPTVALTEKQPFLGRSD